MLDLDQRGNWSWYETPPSYLLICYRESWLTLTLKDVTTRGNYYPDKSMATPSVSKEPFFSCEENQRLMLA